MVYFDVVICFLVGISLGSFMNVMNYRIPLGKSVFFPASSCPKCNHKIKFYENVPVFGWLFLNGKCSNCKDSISSEYMFVELFFGLFTVLFFYMYDFAYTLQTVSGLLMFYFLFSLSIIDLKLKEVPISLLVLSFIFAILFSGNYLYSTLSGFIVLGFFYMFKLIYEYFRGIEVLGEGDLPILCIFGIILGLNNILIVAILVSCIFGLFFSAFIYITKKEVMIPFIPSLVCALLVTHFYYFDSIKTFVLIRF